LRFSEIMRVGMESIRTGHIQLNDAYIRRFRTLCIWRIYTSFSNEGV